MQSILISIVAVAGTLLGSYVTSVLQRRTMQEARCDERREGRRREFLDAIDAYTSAANHLRRAEHDRAKKRISNAPPEAREDVRQETYRLRTEAWSAYYRLSLRAEPGADDDLLRDAETIMELSRRITEYTETEAEMERRSSEVKEKLKMFETEANRHVNETYPL